MPHFLLVLVKRMRRGTLRDNLLAVNIYYQDLSMEVLTQQHSYDIFSLIGPSALQSNPS